jgi:hypothetical protein
VNRHRPRGIPWSEGDLDRGLDQKMAETRTGSLRLSELSGRVGSRHSLQSRAVWDIQAAAVQAFDGQADKLVSGLQSSGGATDCLVERAQVGRSSTIPNPA